LATKINPEKITAIYGKSGVGKSSVLRMIAGLDQPDSGLVKLGDQLWFSSEDRVNLPVSERKIGIVFQDYSLFATMTVEQNMQYASKDGIIPQSIMEMVNALGLGGLLSSFPDELSGGQNQRAAVLRSLCQEPDVLLLDEPFSALDDDSIADLVAALKMAKSRYGTAILIVSHRKDVLLSMADEVIHLKEDGLFNQGLPSELLIRRF